MCALVFDITKNESFEHLSQWKEDFLKHSNTECPNTFPFVVIGNKCDQSEDRTVQAIKAVQWCKTQVVLAQEAEGGTEKFEVKKGPAHYYTIPYFETSTKTGEKVNDAFAEMANLALKHSIRQGAMGLDKLGSERGS